ncbi:MAG: hypothetical protein U5K69_21110 [Balneolaceae bacterium]|nr:hypothetical protein [Balneolaceae bacterium]
MKTFWISILVAVVVAACGGEQESAPESQTAADSGFTIQNIQDTTDAVASAVGQGLQGPESVRYDPDQDLYFVANFNGPGGERDGNGFISTLGPDGTVQEAQFMTGTSQYPLHAPRGMYITGDTLWVADVDGVHGFNKTSGEQAAFVDFSDLEPGFLNDVVEGPSGDLYVTDTGQARLYRVSGGEPVIVQDSLPSSPNGITISNDGEHLILCPWNGVQTFHGWFPADSTLRELTTYESGGDFDGIEIVNDMWIISQPGRFYHLH